MFSKRLIYGAILTTLLTFICRGSSQPTTTQAPTRIDAEPGEFPYVVSLRRDGIHFCGGAIITSRHILTAAHCFVGRADAPYIDGLSIVSGTLKRLGQSGVSHQAKEVVPHPGFSRGPETRWKNDIAIIKLKSPIIMNHNTKTIPVASAPTSGGVVAVLSGWGSHTKKGPEAEILQKRNVTILNNDECNKRDASILDTQMCGFDGRGTGFCNGDSGSPLVYENKVVGIVSFAISCGIGYPDTYTRVHKYLNFINENTNNLESV